MKCSPTALYVPCFWFPFAHVVYPQPSRPLRYVLLITLTSLCLFNNHRDSFGSAARTHEWDLFSGYEIVSLTCCFVFLLYLIAPILSQSHPGRENCLQGQFQSHPFHVFQSITENWHTYTKSIVGLDRFYPSLWLLYSFWLNVTHTCLHFILSCMPFYARAAG